MDWTAAELDRRGAELLVQVLTECEAKTGEGGVAIASNESVGGWTKTFTERHLAG